MDKDLKKKLKKEYIEKQREALSAKYAKEDEIVNREAEARASARKNKLAGASDKATLIGMKQDLLDQIGKADSSKERWFLEKELEVVDEEIGKIERPAKRIMVGEAFSKENYAEPNSPHSFRGPTQTPSLPSRLLKKLNPLLKVGGKVGLPLVALASNYQEAKEEGLAPLLALGYAGIEELNPLPFSGIDYLKGVQESAKERAENMSNYYEQEAKKPYMNSQAAKDRAYSKLRDLLKTEDNKEIVDELLKRKTK